MKLFIKDVDITESDQSIRACNYIDYAGGHADVLQITFNDTFDLWRTWGLSKNDKIRVVKDNIDTGDMYISGISLNYGMYKLRALSTSEKAFNEISTIRENIKLYEICSEISKEAGLQLSTYDLVNYLYSYVERIDKKPLEYLEELLRREGYIQKVYNGKLIVYSEKKMEQALPGITITEDDFISYPNFSTSDADIVSSIENTYQSGSTNFKSKVSSNLTGKKLRFYFPVSSLGEGERFCKGMLRYFNKYEYTGSGVITNNNIAAGVTINIDGNFANWSGVNFIYEVNHDLINDTKAIKFRKPIEGDY